MYETGFWNGIKKEEAGDGSSVSLDGN
jgi:hypothetical protein